MARTSAKPESKRQPVPVELALYEKYRNYSKITGIPIARLVHDALLAHYEVTLTTRLETLTRYVAGDRMAASEVPPLQPSSPFTAADAMADAPVLEAGPLPAAEVGLPDWAQDN